MTMIFTGSSLSFQFGSKFHQVHSSHPQFKRIVELAKTGEYEQAVKLVDLKETIAASLKGTRATLKNDNVYFDGELVRSQLAKRIISMAKEGFDATPLLKFLENLMSNPSKRAVDELYGFLEASSLPITDDGHFLAYKSVRQDFKDHHSGTMDNSVGAIVEMPRNGVDEDKDRTCSAGLHFAAHEYANGFGRSGRMVVLKINPRDVVAIPSDYRNQKGRCCRYEVVEEVGRSDTKLVGKGFVDTKAKVVLDLATLTKGNTYEFSGNLSVFNPALQKPFTGEYLGDGTLRVISEGTMKGQTQSFQAPRSRTGLIATLVNPVPYIPQADNYTDRAIWDMSLGIQTFIGKTKDFPVNRDVPYVLERKSTKKEYRGEFYFVNYDEANDNLVFARRGHDGQWERYVTISDISDWYVQFDVDTKDN